MKVLRKTNILRAGSSHKNSSALWLGMSHRGTPQDSTHTVNQAISQTMICMIYLRKVLFTTWIITGRRVWMIHLQMKLRFFPLFLVAKFERKDALSNNNKSKFTLNVPIHLSIDNKVPANQNQQVKTTQPNGFHTGIPISCKISAPNGFFR